MNKQDALTKLAALEAETKALRAIIEAPDKPALPTRWRPEGTDVYYQVAIKGDVAHYDERLPISDKEYEHGNCFKTEQQAAIAAKVVSVTLKVCAAAFAVDPQAKPSVGGEHAYCVVYRASGAWGPVDSSLVESGRMSVRTREQAKQWAAILNAEGVTP